MYAQGHWAAGVLGTIATVGWTVQGLGSAFYYRQVRYPVRSLRSSSITRTLADMEAPHSCRTHHGQGDLLCQISSQGLGADAALQAKAELTSHGAKAYFTRG